MLSPQFITDSLRDVLVPLDDYFKDRKVTEIMCNPGGRVYIEREGLLLDKGMLLDEHYISSALILMGRLMSRDVRDDDASAVVDSNFDGMRVAGALNTVCPDGSFISIRKHQPPEDRPTMAQLIEWGAVSERQAEFLRRVVIEGRRNCLIAGGTSSGKTTVTNAVLGCLPAHERIAVIEDSRELQIAVQNRICLVTNPTFHISARLLVKLGMRIRPDRIILGETRGDETYDVLRAFNSGHDGSITTVHASSAESALDALEMLFQMSLPPGASIPTQMIRSYIAKSVHVLVFAARTQVTTNGVTKYVRKVDNIYLVKGVANDGQYILEAI
jgi:Flp pilus assembly CpaF family ATPase